VRFTLTAAAVIYVIREQYWGDERSLWQVIMACTVAVVAQACFAIARSNSYARVRGLCLRGSSSREVEVDAASLVVMAGITTVACLIGVAFEQDANAKLYFWSDMATRLWSFVRFPVLVALALLVIRRTLSSSAGRPDWFHKAVAATCAVLCLLALAQADYRSEPRLERELAELGRPVNATTLEPRSEENRLYYLLATVSSGRMQAEQARVRLYQGRPISCAALESPRETAGSGTERRPPT
jgi:hypothetical protein